MSPLRTVASLPRPSRWAVSRSGPFFVSWRGRLEAASRIVSSDRRDALGPSKMPSGGSFKAASGRLLGPSFWGPSFWGRSEGRLAPLCTSGPRAAPQRAPPDGRPAGEAALGAAFQNRKGAGFYSTTPQTPPSPAAAPPPPGQPATRLRVAALL
ncbi:hypothetical protein M885DRAFT_288110 [Pelagophyceae sp. CCMP2097]|nr:hypothetical protein M885DRAFT_288110 [Pelagophyceae sp. CCMP2097]